MEKEKDSDSDAVELGTCEEMLWIEKLGSAETEKDGRLLTGILLLEIA